LTTAQRQVWQVLPIGRPAQIDELAERAGMDAMSVQIALGPLELAGLARRRGELWSRPASVAS